MINNSYKDKITLVFFGYKQEMDFKNILDGVRYVYFKPSSINHFYKEINACAIDLFFIPIIDNEFNRRSEDLDKYLDITILKKPILTVDMYPYNSVIGDKYNGFLFEKREIFFDYLKDLLSPKNFGLIRLCANHAHEAVLKKLNYSLENKMFVLDSYSVPETSEDDDTEDNSW